jgi:hypothetical protein
LRKREVNCLPRERNWEAAPRGTGITAYLANSGTLEKARQMAGHASPPLASSTTDARTASRSMKW